MNFFESLLSSEFTRAFAWTLFHSIWQGGLIALVAAGLMTILRKHRPGLRYLALYALLLLIPVIFTATFLYIYHPDTINDYSGTAASVSSFVPGEGILPGMPAIAENGSPDAWYVYPVHIFEKQAGWMVLLWFTGFLIFLLRFSGSMLYVYRLKNYRVCQVGESWNDNLVRLSGRIGLQRTVMLAESALARIPMTIGYLKPVILLPLGTLSGLPPQQIDAILLHELAHILRKDYLLNIIQSVIELLFFYHPVTWWLSALIRQEREHICDDLVISINHDHVNYIKALTTMEEINSKTPLLASALAGRRKNLLFRVKRLISPVKPGKGLGEGIVAFVMLIGLVFALSFNALSVIPSAYDLSGRESGEKVFNLLPFNPNDIPGPVSGPDMHQAAEELDAAPVIPDTAIARSKSGKVIIKVCTDSTDNVQQEELDRMAESVDRQALQYDKAMKEYQVQTEKFKDDKDRIEKECKIMVIRKSDSTSTAGDSIIVIYDDSKSSYPGYNHEYRMVPRPDCPVPPHAREFRYLYSVPDIPGTEGLEKELFSYRCDSIDSSYFIGPGGHVIIKDFEDFDWSPEDLEEQMRDLGFDLENEHHDMERKYYEKELQEKDMERYLFYNLPPVPPEPLIRDYSPAHREVSAERIIRQELREDGLIIPQKDYIIDLDSNGMYINGEKQPKEIYKKYRHLVEGLEAADLESGDNYRLIF